MDAAQEAIGEAELSNLVGSLGRLVERHDHLFSVSGHFFQSRAS